MLWVGSISHPSLSKYTITGVTVTIHTRWDKSHDAEGQEGQSMARLSPSSETRRRETEGQEWGTATGSEVTTSPSASNRLPLITQGSTLRH